VHELSVCQALLMQVAVLARARDASAVERITIECGPLSGVEPDQLRDAFAIMRRGGIADRAQLLIECSVVIVLCEVCDAQSTVQPNRLVCAGCGGFRTRVVAGDELWLRRVEMNVPDACQGEC
jgi:hydrogenase nickel incorporation protein HypA/HybF